MSTNPFDVVLGNRKKKKKSPFDTTPENPFDAVLSNTGPSLEDSIGSTNINSKGQTDFSALGTIGDLGEAQKPMYVPKEVTPLSVISAGLSASTRFMDSMATKGYSIWDALTPFTLGKMIEKGPVTFIKDIGNSLSDVGNELKDIGVGLFTPTDTPENQAKAVGVPIEQYMQLPINQRSELLKAVPKPREYTSSDLIEKFHPEFAKEYPIATTLVGLIGDLALDPTTYIGFESALPRIAGKRITLEGKNYVRELNELAESGFRATIQNQGIEHVLEFGPAEVRQLRYVEDTLGTVEAQKVLTKYLSSYGDINSVAIHPLTSPQRQRSIESSFLSLARNNPNLVQEEGLGLFARIPVIGEVPIIPTKTVNSFMEKTGLDKLRNSIKESLNTKPVESVRNLFSRDYDLPESYLDLRHSLEGQLNRIDHQVVSSTIDIFKLPEKSRSTLTALAAKIDERIALKTESIRTTVGNPKAQLSDKVINYIRQNSLNDALMNKEITTNEFDSFTKFIAAHNQLANLEAQAKLYKQTTQNYIKGQFFNTEQRQASGLITQAVAKGFVPETDLAALYALRMKNSLNTLAEKQFKGSVETLFSSVSLTGKVTVNYPTKVGADLELIGHTYYASNTAELTKPLLKLYDTSLGVWKKLAYAIKPSASIKQYFGNTLQSFAKIGPSAFKTLDPRSLIEATVLVADKSSFSKIVPQFLLDGVQKYGTVQGKMIYAINKMEPSLVDKYSMVTRLGERIDGPSLMNELIDQDIYHKGQNILSIDQAHDLKLEIGKANGFLQFQESKMKQGFFKFLEESIPWINMPNNIETINRTAMYINARKIGYLPKEAKKLVNEALFDYAHGLSNFERTVARRIVPFYTFQRFALPLIGSLVKNPGRAVSLKKITESFFEVWNDISSGKKLTEDQRSVLPGLLLEQPSVFEGFSQDPNTKVEKGVFRTFNNYNFTDMLSLIQLDEDGSIDFGKTVQKMTLAQITPIIKVPLERLYGKNFFTDQAIPKGGKVASGDITTFKNIKKEFEENVPDLVKHAVGFEVRIDPQTNQETGYINPYLAHMMQSFVPAINDYISISRDDLNSREFAMKYLAGIGTVKLDFEKAKSMKIREREQEIKELQIQMRRHMLSGNPEVVNEDHAKLQEIIKQIDKLNNRNVTPNR